MKKILENTAETREYLESLPKIYMIARWAGYGVREFPFAGKCTTDGIPFVWRECVESELFRSNSFRKHQITN